MPVNIKDGIVIGIDGDDDPFMRLIAATAARSKKMGEEIGRNLSVGVSGVSQSRNMAADMGLGNNFVFAIQDATSAVGQFGFTTTALRFAILGATNNIQIMVMQAALAGVTFRTLATVIRPIHIALALFSAGVSLLPLLFSNSSKASKDLKDSLKEQHDELERGIQLRDNLTKLEPKQKFPLKVDVGELRSRLREAENVEGLTKRELAFQDIVVSNRKADVKVAEGRLRLARIGTGDRGPDPRMAAARELGLAAKELNTQLLKQHELQQRLTRETQIRTNREEQLTKELAKQTRPLELAVRQHELRLKRLQLPPDRERFEFSSPEDLINKVQAGMQSGEEKMLKVLENQLAVEQEQLALEKAQAERDENLAIIGN